MWVIPPEGSQNCRGGPEKFPFSVRPEKAGRDQPEQTGPDRAGPPRVRPRPGLTRTAAGLKTGFALGLEEHKKEAYLYGRPLFCLVFISRWRHAGKRAPGHREEEKDGDLPERGTGERQPGGDGPGVALP